MPWSGGGLGTHVARKGSGVGVGTGVGPGAGGRVAVGGFGEDVLDELEPQLDT